jgi:hypothetical protein
MSLLRSPLLFVVALAVLASGACPQKSTPGRLFDATGESPLPKDFIAARGLVAKDAAIDAGFTLIAMAPLTETPKGERIPFTLYWRVDDTPSSSEGLKAFVHIVVPGGELPMAQADHALAGGAVDLATLRPGDVVEDTFHVVIPRDFPVDRALVRTGLYQGKKRFAVTRGAHDGQNRVEIAAIDVDGGAPALPTYDAKKRTGPIVLDGVLDESDWQGATVTSAFVRHDGRGKLRQSTTARLLWDDSFLYVAFEATDSDVHTPYTKRDDPLYESEAVEVFIDADGDKDVYIELQSAPNDVHFDAAFAGGRRKNFDTGYDVAFETKTLVDGTLNDPSDTDRGFVSEWRIPIAAIKDVPSPPTVGAEWKFNLFRLERVRKDGKVVATEASAWSSPYSGDFHNLDRMGTLRFVE